MMSYVNKIFLFDISQTFISVFLRHCSLLEILSIFNTLIYYCYSEWAVNLLRHWSPNVVVTDNNPRRYPLLLVISKKEARAAAHHGEGGGGKVLVSPL